MFPCDIIVSYASIYLAALVAQGIQGRLEAVFALQNQSASYIESSQRNIEEAPKSLSLYQTNCHQHGFTKQKKKKLIGMGK